VVERGTDVANAISKVLERPRMDKAMVLFVLSDHRLPFGQLRIRSAFDKEDRRLQSAYRALGPGNRATCLYIGAGWAPAGQALLAAEVGALPRVLGNAATAIEVWLSEADLGLVMRFVNRPEVYEMPPGWPYTQQVLASPGAEHPDGLPPAEDDRTAPGEDPGMLQSYNQGSLVGPAPGDEFTLFDLNRNNATDLPEAVLAPLSPRDALAALAHRPPGVEALLVAGRRYPSLSKLQRELVKVLLETEPGRHLRFEDDENAMKALLSFHPDGDRLLEDLVAIKVDCSPIDDDTRCMWVIKYDGYEEDVSLKTCLQGLQEWVHGKEQPTTSVSALELQGSSLAIPRLGPGRWTQGLRESTFDRAKIEERRGIDANK